MKKTVILYSGITTPMVPQILNELENAGFVEQHNLLSTQILVSATTNPGQLVAQVQDAAPDIVISINEFSKLVSALEGISVPVIVNSGAESYVNTGGMPTANVTGIYSTLPDMVYSSYKFLQKVAPLKPGQQAVFLEVPEVALISTTEVMEALQRLQIPLKAVVDATIYEDWQQAILQYNNDPEVGWILYGTGPVRKRDGSNVDVQTEMASWDREYLKKPMVTYWELAVRWGALCGFSIDSAGRMRQVAQLAVRVLNGELIQTIKAEYPRKVSIALNRKTATTLGIVFSLDVLNLADVIYDDYEGKQVIRK